MTDDKPATIETAYAAGAARIATLEVTETEPDGNPVNWSLGPIVAIARRPRTGEDDLFEIWPLHLPTIIRVPAGTPVHFTLAQSHQHTPPPPLPPTGPRPSSPPPWLPTPPRQPPH
ncbi:hypothetical protein [Streptomyces rhizosphaericus]|uniref:hypothetical protein n=1 Tax=Streptomyces rhizosphaericus TaxID=114699 RepID=UPI001B343CC5|nr:hypothetical protein [Streptomyces rhizosphaericus]